ncbi:MAG: nucleotide sugar dehydrogenase [Ignavibacteriaceae bacterium]|jgi:UDP-N-acetyl-D-glucosamine dehydrogenase|nr:nucleotide sugar dehydrogenase [Ignavibacteriaceae bacterium]MCU0406993.1 nucleotide sugar dehydrogenase [Ignavibacteriaceae bacterium]
MNILKKIKNKSVIVGIVGMGYVGLPLGLAFAAKKINVLGFDLDEKKINLLNKGKGYLNHISDSKIKKAVDSGYLKATTNFSRLPEVDAILICVPTPLTKHREPDMSFVENTSKTIAKYLRKEQLIVLESTTYPGTTEELLLPMFEITGGKNKFKVGEDFYLAFSPEREDPNNPDYTTAEIPKVIGGVTPQCSKVAKALYDQVIIKTVLVSSPKAAEATKLLENIYRSVNIALVNELKMVFDKMNIDVWEVISAASTKPFGFKAFYPGPGLGGHCIPIDPFYLTWKAREFEISTKFIELAGEINTLQPLYVVEKSVEALNQYKKTLNGSKVLILGAAYKKDIDDMRESPSLKLIEIYRAKGARVDYYDPYVPKLPKTRKYHYDLESIYLTKGSLSKYDLVVLSTDHEVFDYEMIAKNSKLIIDTRNAFEKKNLVSKNIFKA